MKAVEIKDLSFAYGQEDVLRDCQLQVETGEMTLILGGNGSGKSTLLKLMLGELKAQKGEIQVLGKRIQDYRSFKKIGYVPQINIVNKIAFPITCLELVALNLYEDFGLVKIPRKKHYAKAEKILEDMGLGDYKKTPVNELSGGLQQRAMICRAMIKEPELLILDEPTAGVDKVNKEKFFQTIAHLNQDLGITIIMVTHELKEVESCLEIARRYSIEEGRLIQC